MATNELPTGAAGSTADAGIAAGPPAGWYASQEQPGWQRYWDGGAWTDHWRPAPGAIAATSSPAASGAAGAFRSPLGLATASTVLVALVAGLGLVLVYVDAVAFVTLDQLSSAAGADALTLARRYDALELVSGVLNVLAALLLLAAGIVFIIWFRRAYLNLATLGIHPRFRAGWAVGSWFVPIFNLIRPKSMMNDIWKGTESALKGDRVTNWYVREVPWQIQAWWTAWVVLSLVGSWLLRLDPDPAPTLDQLIRSDRLYYLGSILWDVALVVAGALIIHILREVTRRQVTAVERVTPALGGGQ